MTTVFSMGKDDHFEVEGIGQETVTAARQHGKGKCVRILGFNVPTRDSKNLTPLGGTTFVPIDFATQNRFSREREVRGPKGLN